MRLEHLLMKHLVLSRREMKKLIKNEAVLIDGVPATHLTSHHGKRGADLRRQPEVLYAE